MAQVSSGFRTLAPPSINTGRPRPVDAEYDYRVGGPEEIVYRRGYNRPQEVLSAQQRDSVYNRPHDLLSPPSPPNAQHPHYGDDQEEQDAFEHDDALLDAEQLEQLHMEAERMKALGNKHMAAQEYTRAYNAYSAALQLSPVGPSSHVFLSNRAAALLSLKRYSAAATDSRRAVALAPTFGKAHARLGQSLYFLKDYAGAVAAYEDAVNYEPDNGVTRTYLEKARAKLIRQREKSARQSRGEDYSMTDEQSLTKTVANSIATDPLRASAVVQSGFRSSSAAIMQAVANQNPPREVKTGNQLPTTPMTEGEEPEDDPDFDEALRLQQRANRLLMAKKYKQAIEEYSAALFLIPDDPFLSPELHLGRAHALNGSRRHMSARNDAALAVKIRPTPEAYSTLAKSEFYLKNYLDSIEAFENCIEMLPEGESMSMFDQAYFEKAQEAFREQIEGAEDDRSVVSSRSTKSVVPKLPPPRFVTREEAIIASPNLPSMPKEWPQQSPRTPSSLHVGPERVIMFLSESLGIKLNRGADGIVRVFSVTPNTARSAIVRKGLIEIGDVVREAAGVDIRRPITNIMWSDTIALVKIAPRPITFVVAAELSETPASVQKEQAKMLKAFSLSPAQASVIRGEMKSEI